MIIQRRYQTIVKRVAAEIIDAIVFIPVAFLFFYLNSNTDRFQQLLIDLLFAALVISYSAIMHARYGQTLGKMASSVMVFTDDERSRPALGQCFAREIYWVFYYLFDALETYYDDSTGEKVFLYASLGMLVAQVIVVFINHRRKAIHDYIAGTVVLDVMHYRRWDFEFEQQADATGKRQEE